MKLAECLLQEKPIRHALHRGRGIWFVPKIKKHDDKLHIATADLYNLHTLSPEDFTSDDWEIKQEPLKHEFKSEVLDALYIGYLHLYIVPSSFIGKKVKVIVEEIVE